MSKTTKMIAALGIVAGLGVAALPFGAFALTPVDQHDSAGTPKDDTAEVTVSVTVTPSIAIALGASDVTEIESIAPKAANTTTMATNITLSTNAAKGYTLKAKDANGGTLNKAADTDSAAATISAVSSSKIEAGTSAFGYKSSGNRGASSETGGEITGTKEAWTAFTSTDAVIAQANKKAADDTFVVTYGVSTAADQAQGTYTDTITYTAAVVE